MKLFGSKRKNIEASYWDLSRMPSGNLSFTWKQMFKVKKEIQPNLEKKHGKWLRQG